LMDSEFPDSFATYGGVDITLHKNIPVAAGLAGGSTDAAAVLVGIDLLWKLGLTRSELEDLGAKLGSDVPFCIGGGTAIATGRGEILSPLLGLSDTYIVLAKYSSLEVSTPWAYTTYRSLYSDSYVKDKESLTARASAVHSGEIVKTISNQDASEVAQKMHNDLEKVVLPEYPQVSELKKTFAKYDILGTMMSGSGPSVFALCESKEKAEQLKINLRNEIPSDNLELFVTRLINHGIQVR
ncbi:MAG: 4-(cytidine 5'-diphospho)-2-C-methyl-D-erythritol kinase, partial [Rivularia sp. ALOHA_DT_140]|nr:4-(cytidine 5'-diphospho)-2-C-methyl-D-erythritol kinase [Rivularia sp. ALOHA_DT_140]